MGACACSTSKAALLHSDNKALGVASPDIEFEKGGGTSEKGQFDACKAGRVDSFRIRDTLHLRRHSSMEGMSAKELAVHLFGRASFLFGNGWSGPLDTPLPATQRCPSERGAQNLLYASQTFGCKYLRMIRAVTARETGNDKLDMVMFGDFGRDLDKEKALCVAVALQRVGLIGELSVVANGSNAPMRARLAKGTANALSADCEVAIGCAVEAEEESWSYEFDHCDYLASEEELDPRGGHELVFAAIRRAALRGHKVCIVVNSALTDMAAVLRDPRWPEACGSVAGVTCMGGAMRRSDGILGMDPTATNNRYDLTSAREVYRKLQASRDPPFFVVSRHAAWQCGLARLAFHGSMHPIAQRLQSVGKDIVQTCWERVHRTEEERRKLHDKMPMRCDVDWFRRNFLAEDAPGDLKACDPVWEYVKELNESCSDGLATLIAALTTRVSLLQELFDPMRSEGGNMTLFGLDSTAHSIKDPACTSNLLHELMVMVIGGGDGAWLRQAASLAERTSPVDVIVIGDYGKDLDDETALCVAAAMRQLGLIGDLAVVANLGDSAMRARLAKGTLRALQHGDVPVAVGSHGGQPDEELYEHEFAHCDYLAPVEDLDSRGGHELIFAALEKSAERGRMACIVLGSAMTDMAAVLEDARWPTARGVVKCVAAMGGAKEEEGKYVMDRSAANNAFDLESAERVYAKLQEEKGLQFVVVSRFAASCCQMPRGALDGSDHSVAQRFIRVSEPGLQKLWERSHRSMEQRQALNDALPARCNAAWFRSTFLIPSTPELLGPQDQIWRYVKGFNEYDALTLIAGVAASHPPLLDEFFHCHHCHNTNMSIIGLDATRHCVAKPSRASELLHDCLVLSFSGKLRSGMFIEIKDSAYWSTYILLTPQRSKGPDVWTAMPQSKSGDFHVELTVSVPLEGVTWRMKDHFEPEPVLQDPFTTITYREINCMKWFPFNRASGWMALREGFQPKPGDVFLSGPFGSGRSSLHVACLALKGSGRLDDVDMGRPYMLEMALSRDRFRVNEIDNFFPPEHRVFKSYFPRPSMPCKPWHGWLPEGVKVIFVARDPRDICVSTFEQAKRLNIIRDPEKWTWAAYLDLFCSGDYCALTGDWLRSTLDWWRAAQACPDQVLWVVFEDMLRDPNGTVRRVARFLDIPVQDSTVAHIAEVVHFPELKRRFGDDFGVCLREGIVGIHEHYFSAEDYRRFREEVLAPAIASGMPLGREVHEDPIVSV